MRVSRVSLAVPAGLSQGDKCNAQSENESGDSEPYRSPKTKLRGTRRRFATASPNEEEPLGAALNPPFLWCPNDAKCRPRQREATGDEERSADYHTSKLTDKLGDLGEWLAELDFLDAQNVGEVRIVAPHRHDYRFGCVAFEKELDDPLSLGA